MTRRALHICSFESAAHLRGRARTYAAVKAAVLAAGKYSIFEATATAASARLFTRLDRDPDLERVDLAYPWIGVRARQAPAATGTKIVPKGTDHDATSNT